MAEIVLKQPRVRALVSESKTARMVEHVGVRVHGQACAFPIAADHEPYGFPTERAASFTEKERLGLRFHSRPFRQPSLDRPYLVTPERVRRGQALFEPRDMQHAAFDVHLGHPQPAGFRHAQTMPEHQGERNKNSDLVTVVRF